MITMYDNNVLEQVFELLDETKGVTQDPTWHPEGDVLNHSLQVFYQACKETYDTNLLMAALLHDVGKARDCKKHEAISARLVEDIVSEKTHWIVKNHMRVKLYLEGKIKKVHKCNELVEHEWFKELIQLTRFDEMGRIAGKIMKYDKDDIIIRLNMAATEELKIRNGEGWNIKWNINMK